MIPFIDLKAQYKILESSINERIKAVLEHGSYILGPEVNELEEALSDRVESRHCITVSSGTDALFISLLALGIGPGDEIITTPFSFVATAEVIVLLGAKPIFVDIELPSCLLDATKIEEKITHRTRAIIPVSLYGQVAEMDKINQIAERNGLFVIEDAAQSFGAEYKGRKSCNLSTVGCTSFFPSKPLGCYGDGGAIFCNDDDLASAIKEIRVHGQRGRYIHERIGVGGRMDTLQCAVILAKLGHFEWEIRERAKIADRYNREFDRMGISRCIVKEDRKSVYAQYTIFVENREKFQNHLQKAGIPSAVHYPKPINEQTAYMTKASKNATPNSEYASASVLSLPMSPYLSSEHQDQVISAVSKLIV